MLVTKLGKLAKLTNMDFASLDSSQRGDLENAADLS